MIPSNTRLKQFRFLLLLPFCCCYWLLSSAQEVKYIKHEVDGFEVFLNEQDLQEYPIEMNAALDFISRKLSEIKNIGLQTSVVSKLTSIPIFLDWNNGNYGSSVYNRGANPLASGSLAQQKWKAIEILNTEIFLRSDTVNQPYLIIHELAHGYHDRLGKFEKDMIALCYQNAMEGGLYDRMVPNQHGDRVYAYARTNEQEYFAELTVAFLFKNTTYPFTATELEVHDPNGYGMLTAIWKKKLR